MSKISVRVLIDKEQRRVVFIEAGSDFVDVLFSFLTLPLGSIVRLLGKKSGLGSLDSLYESVEQLNAKHLQTEACKEMLLNPRSAAAELCEDLKIQNIHDSNPRCFYLCNKATCYTHTVYFSYTPNARCHRCGQLFGKIGASVRKGKQGGEVFINDLGSYMISDDLRVKSASLTWCFSLLEECGIEDAGTLEEIKVDFGTEEVLNLLRRSLVSMTPLTDVCIPDSCFKAPIKHKKEIKREIDVTEAEPKEINVKLFLNKIDSNVLYAQVGVEFVDQLFSFLSFPLGLVIKLLGEHNSVGCVNNLYTSVESMGKDFFKSEECRNMLLLPKLASFHGCSSSQTLDVDEMPPKKMLISADCSVCKRMFNADLPSICQHQLRQAEHVEQNAKSLKGGADYGGGFGRGSLTFMVADNLNVSPVSSISAITTRMKLPISRIVEKDVKLAKAQTLLLMRAMLQSRTTLTDVFLPKPMLWRSY